MRVPGTTSLVGLLVAVLLAGGLTLVLVRHGDEPAGTPGPGRTPGPQRTAPTGSIQPVEPGIATLPAPSATHATGRGRGLYRVIPCYTLTAQQLRRVLDAPMEPDGQRAAGSSGFGLRGLQREDCFWFSRSPDGPYVVLSSITTGQLRDRGLDLTARSYFDTVHDGPRTYLRGIGDAAYAYGPASVAVLVGDVYLDVTVVTSRPRPLAAARDLARLMGRLQVSRP